MEDPEKWRSDKEQYDYTNIECRCSSCQEMKRLESELVQARARIREAEERVRRETIEECAKVAETYSNSVNTGRIIGPRIAADLRSLSVQTKG